MTRYLLLCKFADVTVIGCFMRGIWVFEFEPAKLLDINDGGLFLSSPVEGEEYTNIEDWEIIGEF